MILSDIQHQRTIVRGTTGDILQEFAGLATSILYAQPELFIAVQTILAEEAMELLPQLDSDKLCCLMEEAQNFFQENKKAGTWG